MKKSYTFILQADVFISRNWQAREGEQLGMQFQETKDQADQLVRSDCAKHKDN